MYRVSRHSDVGFDGVSDLVLRTAREQSASGLWPNTRSHFYLGTFNGINVVIKPYESDLEKQVVKLTRGKPFSLVIEHNDTYFMEKIAGIDEAEIAYKKGILNAERLGQAVGVFLADLHLLGVSYSNCLTESLFVHDDGSIKATDFGAASFNPDEKVNDIPEALMYLRDTVKANGIKEIKTAIDAFRHAYSRISDQRFFDKGVKHHFEHTSGNDPLRVLLS